MVQTSWKKQLRLVVYLPFFLRLLVHPKGGDFSHIIFLCEVIRNDSPFRSITTYKSLVGAHWKHRSLHQINTWVFSHQREYIYICNEWWEGILHQRASILLLMMCCSLKWQTISGIKLRCFRVFSCISVCRMHLQKHPLGSKTSVHGSAARDCKQLCQDVFFSCMASFSILCLNMEWQQANINQYNGKCMQFNPTPQLKPGPQSVRRDVQIPLLPWCKMSWKASIHLIQCVHNEKNTIAFGASN